MSYSSISIKDAVNHINNHLNGWFLPAVQRPYVWGSRHENEEYICKLFDSILRGYPIGGLIIWNTEDQIPYREFMSDYQTDNIPRLVDSGLHGRKDKWLIYDGQQRLQTLYSCLKYTFNGRILVYDLLFGLSDEHDPNETGFSFVNRNSEIEWHQLRLNELFSQQPDNENKFENKILSRKNDISLEDKEKIQKNLRQLWKIYVETEKNSLAYFPIRKEKKEDEVNEIFERLNTGGMALSQADLLFSRIKGTTQNHDFEERLQLSSKEIYNKTGKGFIFGAYSILQLLNLIIKGRVRIDPTNVKDEELLRFSAEWDMLEDSLLGFFSRYIFGRFSINNEAIIPRKLALLPIMIYFYEIYKKGFQFNKITNDCLTHIDKYLIKSQLNDWNLQSYADNFSKLIMDISKKAGNNLFDFPISEIEEIINEGKKRNTDVYEESLTNYLWFSLKVLTPDRMYQFDPDIRGRFNPELDHIFPRNLKEASDDYRKKVDTLWNMQPITGDINRLKTNYHPKLFFTNKAKNSKGDSVQGSSYIQNYDFLVPKNRDGTINFESDIWDSEDKFIKARRKLMLDFMDSRYKIHIRG